MNNDTHTDEQRRAHLEHARRSEQLARIERRLVDPFAVKPLTNAIRVGLSTMLEKMGVTE